MTMWSMKHGSFRQSTCRMPGAYQAIFLNSRSYGTPMEPTASFCMLCCKNTNANRTSCRYFRPIHWPLFILGRNTKRGQCIGLPLFQVRQTWGNTTLYAPMRVVIVFSVAVGRQGTNMERSLEREQQLYGDIVQDGSFIDAYNNLSMKVVIYQRHIAYVA